MVCSKFRDFSKLVAPASISVEFEGLSVSRKPLDCRSRTSGELDVRRTTFCAWETKNGDILVLFHAIQSFLLLVEVKMQF